MCIITSTAEDYYLIADQSQVNNSLNLFATKSFYFYFGKTPGELLATVRQYKYSLRKHTDGIVILADSKTQTIDQLLMLKPTFSKGTSLIYHSLTLKLGYHAHLFTQKERFKIVNDVDCNTTVFTIPIMFKQKDIQFIGHKDIVVDSFIIPRPDVLSEIFNPTDECKIYYTEGFEKKYTELYNELEKITGIIK